MMRAYTRPQDALMVVYLSNLTRTQISVAAIGLQHLREVLFQCPQRASPKDPGTPIRPPNTNRPPDGPSWSLLVWVGCPCPGSRYEPRSGLLDTGLSRYVALCDRYEPRSGLLDTEVCRVSVPERFGFIRRAWAMADTSEASKMSRA